ncbi:translation machinery-associated protein 16 [Thamnidium elegans]|nr:translation machinery-associated protein 16 [Thamnidium elegans]
MGNRKITLKTIKNREAIHPYSRKAQQISRVYQRKEKLQKKENQKANNPMGERWIWFRYAFEEDKVVATKPEMHELVEAYLVRHDDEIEELEQDRHRGHKKPKGPRQDHLEALRISERNEYISGMELPDMTNGKTLKLLREWDGDKNSMPRMTTIRLQKPTEPTEKTIDTKNQKNGEMMDLK